MGGQASRQALMAGQMLPLVRSPSCSWARSALCTISALHNCLGPAPPLPPPRPAPPRPAPVQHASQQHRQAAAAGGRRLLCAHAGAITQGDAVS
jgi:hypothetical protein